ncbi:MAG: putative ABC exporter domain-containing protein, partial [Verrucomicrobiota bacterium]
MPVIQALFFLLTRSLWNRLRSRIRRLRQPKYLIGAVVGLAYLYIYVGRFVLGNLFFPRSRPAGFPFAQGVTLDLHDLIEGMAATGVFLFMLGAWVFSGPRSALAFTETELAHLLPAPISRRTLIRYKLASTQSGLLISSLVLWFFTGRTFDGGHAVFRIAGWWIVLAALSLHALGASFAVHRITERGLSSWLRRTLACLVGVAVVGALLWWSRSALLAEGGIPSSLDGWRAFGQHILASGPAPWLLWPFRLLVRPWLAGSATDFAVAIGPALAVLALLFTWVDRSDVAFEEASIERARRSADRIANANARHPRDGMPKPTARPGVF